MRASIRDKAVLADAGIAFQAAATGNAGSLTTVHVVRRDGCTNDAERRRRLGVLACCPLMIPDVARQVQAVTHACAPLSELTCIG